MFIVICLFWIGMQLNAPVWYYILAGFAFFMQILSFGLKMFNKGKASAKKQVN